MNNQNLTPWPKGVSGNPNGRPVGTRQAFSSGFLRDLAEVWAAEGKGTMLHTAKNQPATFFAVCARLLPGDVKLTIEQTYSGLSPEDYEILRAIKEAIPDAGERSPGEVMRSPTACSRSTRAGAIFDAHCPDGGHVGRFSYHNQAFAKLRELASQAST